MIARLKLANTKLLEKVEALERAQYKRPKTDETAAVIVSLQQKMAALESDNTSLQKKIDQLVAHNATLASNHARVEAECAAAQSAHGTAALSQRNTALNAELARTKAELTVVAGQLSELSAKAATEERAHRALQDAHSAMCLRVQKLEQAMLAKISPQTVFALQWLLFSFLSLSCCQQIIRLPFLSVSYIYIAAVDRARGAVAG
jgi:hypothetical protein